MDARDTEEKDDKGTNVTTNPQTVTANPFTKEFVENAFGATRAAQVIAQKR